MIKKKPTKKHAKKKAVKKVSGVHKDTKSHNVKINVLSGISLQTDKIIRKKGSDFLKLSGYHTLAKEIKNKKIPIDKVVNTIDFVIKEKVLQVKTGNYSEQLKKKTEQTEQIWKAYKKLYFNI